ncbi:hypothetical protein JCM21900_001957 [Sporobolomyces salmonicolor]
MTQRRSLTSPSALLLPRPVVGSSSSSLKSALLRSPIARIFFGCCLVVLVYQLFVSSLEPSAGPRRPADFALLDDRFADGEIGHVEGGRTVTLKTYLKALNKPTGEEVPHLWLTVADRHTIHSVTPVLDYFVKDLNVRRKLEGIRGKSTALVILCADDSCMEECIIDSLNSGRDVLFIDADVALNRRASPSVLHSATDIDPCLHSDPYPVLESALDAVDMIAVENATNTASGQISSNFVWSRSTQSVVDVWSQVLNMGLSTGGRDNQVDLNTVLATTELRQNGVMNVEMRRNFASPTAVRVHVLDKEHFAAYRPSNDIPKEMGQDAVAPVAMQLNCGGDILTKTYIAKAQGFHNNANSYYSYPPSLLIVPSFVGSRDDLKQLLKVLVTAAKMSNRALQPPAFATFVDVLDPRSNKPVMLPTHAAFPLPYLSSALNFSLVEPFFSSHALAVLASLPVQNSTTRRIHSELKFPGEIDLRTCETVFDLVRKLSLVSYSAERAVVLTNADHFKSNWREWALPKPTRIVQPCRKLEAGPLCGEVCRLPGSWRNGVLPHEWEEDDAGVLMAREMRKRMGESWLPLKEFLMEGGHISDDCVQSISGQVLTQGGMGAMIHQFQATCKFDAILGGTEEVLADLGVRQAIKYMPQAVL